jgi:Ca2+-transporting ATPase
VILNAIIGFTQQFKAEKAISNLKKLIVPMSKIIRDGEVKEVPSKELVPGDIIILSAGDKISADARIIESENAATNEAVLTGESLPISKEKITINSRAPISKRKNMLFTGTTFVRGTAKALVVKTGKETVFGEIAEDLQGIRVSKTPMQKRLDKFSKQIGFLILGLVFIIAALGFLDKFDLVEMFLISVALAVSAIPEGLPAVLTMGFAISSLMMSKKNVVIRRLPAVESLGSVTVICTDKTGTLTE